MKKIIIVIMAITLGVTGTFSLSLSADPVTREYPYLYKSTRALGMGGAYTAVGGTLDTLFYNPAGLANVPEDNREVNILNPLIEIDENLVNYIKDMIDALDTEDLNNDGDPGDDQLKEVNKVIVKYQGEPIHGRLSLFPGYAQKNFGMGFLAQGSIDVRTHQGLGSAGILEMNGGLQTGPVAGISREFEVRGEDLAAGVGVKYIYRNWLRHSFTAQELVDHEEDMDTYTEKLIKEGGALGIDAGVLWRFLPESSFQPIFGVSLLNIGDLDFGEAGNIPMTFNMGVSVSPLLSLSIPQKLILALDYVDVTGNYTEDNAIAKRLRIGAEASIIDNALLGLILRAGAYQGYLTAGLDVRLAILKLSYVTYAEEVGAYAGQDEDRRHLVQLAIDF